MKNSYPPTTETAVCIFISFMSTYLCESGFLILLQIKSKQRNKLDVKDDLHCVQSQTEPCIQLLLDDKQEQILN